MKVAIIGSGIAAIELASRFIQLDAHVLLYSNGRLCRKLYEFSHLSPNSLIPNHRDFHKRPGFQLLKSIDSDFNIDCRPINYDKFCNEYLNKLVKAVSKKVVMRNSKALRVSKSFFTPNILERRLRDLFRVVYLQNYVGELNKQINSNEKLLEGLKEDDISALYEPLERFDEVDIVVEATGFSPDVLGAGKSLAINEEYVKRKSGKVYNINHYPDSLSHFQSVALIGNSQNAWLCIEKLIQANPEIKIDWIYSDVESPINCEKVLKILEQDQEKLSKRNEEYRQGLFEWRSQPDYIRVKLKEPTAPTANINIINLSLISMDILSNQEGIYLTLGNEKEHRSLSTEAVFDGGITKQRKSISQSLIDNEPGYYRLMGNEPIEKIDDIIQDLMKYFTAKETV